MADEFPDNDGETPEPQQQVGFNPAGIALGMAVGVAIGVALDNLAIGIGIGAGVGMLFSVAMGQRGETQ